MSFTLFLALAAQVGPFTGAGTSSPSPLPPELRDRQSRPRASAPVPAAVPAPPAPSRLQTCLAQVARDPAAAVDPAAAWFAETAPLSRGEPQLCLGSAYAALGRWEEAEAAFVNGRDSARPTDTGLRARLGAMAGNAALARGSAPRALTLLDPAKVDAATAGDAALGAEVQLDRARALVLIGKDSDAAAALSDARTAAPGNAQAWLLSATLSRRMGKLAEAQAQIEQAASLAPLDPEVGLEAGVIAVLAGRVESARKSWQSVIAAAPDSEAAKTAKGYVEQLGRASAHAVTPGR